ncbi:MAG: type IV pilus twitching motility protein PilT [Bradymonadia bacterium]
MGNQTPTLNQLLELMIQQGASDLHITTGSPPQLRIDGQLIPVRIPRLMAPQARALCLSHVTEEQRQRFEETRELDFSFGIPGLARFRANLYWQRGSVSGAFRAIPTRVMTLEELQLPRAVTEMASRPQGLFLVTGPTGSGKSTTLASIIDFINTHHRGHIITIEDPIEFLHEHKNCLINQRELRSDTHSFAHALKYVLRQDPDVVLIGEMRDPETMEAALTIAETGHLCMATLHTNGAVQSINRIIDSFPTHRQAQVRVQLSFVLEAVLSQQLLPKASGSGRVMACELMLATPAIRNLIREGKTHQIYGQMQVGQQQHSMQTLNQCLHRLIGQRRVTPEAALARSPDPDELRQMIQGRRGVRP